MRKLEYLMLLSMVFLLFITLMSNAVSAISPIPVFIEPGVPLVSDDNLFYGNVTLWVTEDTSLTNVTSVLFEYYDGIEWRMIGTDTNGSIPTIATYEPAGEGDGWSMEWDTVGLQEGLYQIRVTATNDLGETGQTFIDVYLDPTPPIPSIIEPILIDHKATVSEIVTIEATTFDENVVSFAVLEKSVPEYKEKGLEPKKSTDYKFDRWGCFPVAAASSILYLAKNGYENLEKEAGKKLTQKELVEKLGDAMKTNNNRLKKKGTLVDDGVNGLKKWIKDKGYEKNLKIRYWGPIRKLKPVGKKPNYRDYAKELKSSEDVLLIIEYTIKGKTYSHVLAGNSVSQKQNKDGTYNVDLMDPATGKIINTKMKTNGDIWYTIKVNADQFQGWAKTKHMITISPLKTKKRVLPPFGPFKMIGTDNDGRDGWSVPWDTNEYLPGSYHLVWAMMTDAMNHTAVTEFEVQIAYPVGGIAVPVDKLALLAPYIALAVAVVAITVGSVYARKRWFRKAVV